MQNELANLKTTNGKKNRWLAIHKQVNLFQLVLHSIQMFAMQIK